MPFLIDPPFCDHPEAGWLKEPTVWHCPVCGEKHFRWNWEVCGVCHEPRLWHFRPTKDSPPYDPLSEAPLCSREEFQPTGRQWPFAPPTVEIQLPP